MKNEHSYTWTAKIYMSGPWCEMANDEIEAGGQ
jgi:hypothetical protein